ncbi:MAG TPA: threonine aldolase family protein, partial [Gaiellaceae bacterium]|nr:threonine aldolase family protein [Gaiellaceae bacterium]
MIDLRSDTMTRPSPAMREAMAEAVVGDEQYGEDPTVLELEQRAAAFLGHEAAVFVPTATMANQIALRILTQPGDELLAEENAHVLLYEQGGPAVFSGLVMRGLPGRHGTFAPEQVHAAVRDWGSGHMPRTRVVSIENTHNSSGGRTWSLEQIDAIAETAREHDLNLHLDGARIVNAATALGVPSAEIGRRFDAVTLCLSKGLGCPLGALVAGSAELMVAARRGKHLFGGAMRQAGIV